MRVFENHVQKVKNEVYTEVAKLAFSDELEDKKADISKVIDPGPNPRFRCCIYHERAVTNERVKSSISGINESSNIIDILDSACDGCQVNRYAVSDLCRGCISHRCQQSCPVGAISIVNNKALIDSEKCIECGRCKAACPYDAIADILRPCMRVCPTGAITVTANNQAQIDEDKCIQCGACVYICPFGAAQDKSQIVQVIEQLKNPDTPVIAMVAPALADSFGYTEVGKVVSAIKSIGFKDVVEVALGADMIIQHETHEFLEVLKEDGVMTSSCCPAFVSYINKKYPELSKYISKSVSPMIASALLIKSVEPNSKVVFIGPCVAKKEEMKGSCVDYVLTFEELSGMIDLDKIDDFEPSPLDNASYFGRRFAATGGVAGAIQNELKDRDDISPFQVIVCDGFAEIDKTLRLLKAGKIKRAFIEGMACKGGCVKGPVSIHYGKTNKKALEKYCSQATEESPDTAVRIISTAEIPLDRQ